MEEKEKGLGWSPRITNKTLEEAKKRWGVLSQTQRQAAAGKEMTEQGKYNNNVSTFKDHAGTYDLLGGPKKKR